MKKSKRVLLTLLSLITVLGLIACGSSSKGDYAALSSTSQSYMADFAAETEEYGFYYDTDSKGTYNESESIADSSDSKILNDSARKLIKTYNLELETENFDGLLNAIDSHIAGCGGYLQDLSTYNGSSYSYTKGERHSSMTVRIPAANLDSFVEFVGEVSNVTNKTLSVEDVTLEYVDTEAKKAAYEIEQERLLDLLEKAESIEDMITIESRLSEVRYELESQESIIRTYDNLVDYATVYIYISEVKEYTAPEPVSYGEQVLRSLTDGIESVIEALKDFFINFVYALPALIVLAIIAVIIIFIVKALKKAKSKKLQAKKEARAQVLMNEAMNKAKEKADRNE